MDQRQNQPGIEGVIRHNDREIAGFFKEYRWLSNMWLCEIPLYGELYASVENAYVASKVPTDDFDYMIKTRKEIQALTPEKAKRFGRTIRIREDWEEKKVEVMRELIYMKFSLHPPLNTKLQATGDKHLEEANYWHDVFWGTCQGRGQNWLGRILMDVRSLLKDA